MAEVIATALSGPHQLEETFARCQASLRNISTNLTLIEPRWKILRSLALKTRHFGTRTEVKHAIEAAITKDDFLRRKYAAIHPKL
jgi:hypothetical protein